jgi:uncharacterized membrane protein YidH (DUF202 family)
MIRLRTPQVKHDHPEPLLLNEVQLLLAEKRTYLASLRTGITVFTVPLSVVVFVIATSEYHNILGDIRMSALIIGGLMILAMIGLYVAYRSERKIKKINRLVNDIRASNKHVAEIVI